MKLASEDEESIRATAREWERSWNAHDMRRLADLFTDDSDFVSVHASHWRGRKEIALQHEIRHQTRFRSSIWHTRVVSVSALASDVALVHVHWERHGDFDFEDRPTPVAHGLFTWILLRQAGRWLIRAAQNTNVLPRLDDSSEPNRKEL